MNVKDTVTLLLYETIAKRSNDNALNVSWDDDLEEEKSER